MTDTQKDSPPGSVKYEHGRHPNSLANLKPFPPGTNGNPRPGYSLTSRLKDSLNKPLRKPTDDAPVGDHIVYETIRGALEHEVTPLREVWDRNDGPSQSQAPIAIDNRQVKIYVIDGEAKELLERIGERLNE